MATSEVVLGDVLEEGGVLRSRIWKWSAPISRQRGRVHTDGVKDSLCQLRVVGKRSSYDRARLHDNALSW